MDFQTPNDYLAFEGEVAGQRRYIRTQQGDNFLKAVAASCDDRLEVILKGTEFARAQEGPSPFEHPKQWPNPWPAERMKPQYNLAREGRANPTGIPFLYLATNQKTAILEIRPALALYVTVAFLVTTRDLRLVNCARGPHYNGGIVFYDPGASQPEPSVRAQYVWNHIDNAFSQPWLRNDFHPGYAATQVLAELFKTLGYDGIRYKSVFGSNDHNVVLFQPDDANIIATELVSITKMDCTWQVVPKMPLPNLEGLDDPPPILAERALA